MLNRLYVPILIFIISAIQLPSLGYGQSVKLFNPLSVQPAISGSFGEIRNDHFHSGVDFRTNGKIGFKVYASENGFVSRIKVSAVGFGKTIYIEHPDGLTTVYAHLNNFSDKITRMVEKEQYAQKSFEVELFPTKDEIPVKKGEVIGLSGNSGSSGGPHLHYEVRHTASQIPMAPLKFFTSWNNIDSTSPTIKNIYLYQIDSIGYMSDSLEQSPIKFHKKGNRYYISDTVYAQGKTGLGIELYDFVNEQSNLCGFKEISLLINKQKAYNLNLDSFSFAETKYVNSIVDYRYKMLTNKEVVKLWADINNKFSGLSHYKSSGLINVENGKVYTICIYVEDHAGNRSTIQGVIKGKLNRTDAGAIKPSNVGILLEYNKEHLISTDEYDIVIPKDALYHNTVFNHSSELNINSNERIYKVNSSKIPIHKKFVLRIKQPAIKQELLSHAYIGYIKGKEVEYCESRMVNGNIETTCSKFGNYKVAADTIPPKLTPINISNKSNLSGKDKIQFHLSDATGINTYKGYIDNNWVLFEWDPKTETLFYTFNKNRIKANSWHTLKVEVTDSRNNKTEYNCDFMW